MSSDSSMALAGSATLQEHMRVPLFPAKVGGGLLEALRFLAVVLAGVDPRRDYLVGKPTHARSGHSNGIGRDEDRCIADSAMARPEARAYRCRIRTCESVRGDARFSSANMDWRRKLFAFRI
jgi:hypothetical protein